MPLYLLPPENTLPVPCTHLQPILVLVHKAVCASSKAKAEVPLFGSIATLASRTGGLSEASVMVIRVS